MRTEHPGIEGVTQQTQVEMESFYFNTHTHPRLLKLRDENAPPLSVELTHMAGLAQVEKEMVEARRLLKASSWRCNVACFLRARASSERVVSSASSSSLSLSPSSLPRSRPPCPSASLPRSEP